MPGPVQASCDAPNPLSSDPGAVMKRKNESATGDRRVVTASENRRFQAEKRKSIDGSAKSSGTTRRNAPEPNPNIFVYERY